MTSRQPYELMLRGPTYYRLKHVWQRSRILASWLRGAPSWSGLRIFGYHSVASSPNELALPPHRFRAHMTTFGRLGLSAVPLAGDLALLDEGRHVAITFDDGYRDLLDVAPLLEQLRIPATVFVCTRVLDGEVSYPWYRVQPPLLTWDDLRKLVAGGWISVGAHTRTHPILPLLDEETARAEIEGSKRDLEDRLQVPVDAFCYPGGLFDEREVELVAAAGFRYACTGEPGTNDASTDLLRLRRTMIDRRDTSFDFRAKVTGRLDRPSGVRSRLRRRLLRDRPDPSDARRLL